MYFDINELNLPRHSLVLLGWIRQAENNLWQTLPPVPVAASARQKISRLLFERLNDIASPALNALLAERLSHTNPIAALNIQLVPQVERDTASAELLEELERTDLASIRTMPILLEQLDRSTVQFTDMIQDMLKRIYRNRADIASTFFSGKEFGEITDISCDGSDLHENGRCTVILTTQAGKFLYKPHDCQTDALYAQLVEQFFSDITYAPHCVVAEGYGFCEFICASSAIQPEEIRQYFHNFGSLSALFHALGSSDLHTENFLASGTRPVLIDLETILTPSPRVFGEAPLPEQLSRFTDAYNHSLAPSSLLPNFTGGRDLSPLMNRESAGRGLPMLDGMIQTVRNYMEDFLSGFEAGYRRCMELRGQLETSLQSFRHIRIRRLLRQTNYYSILQRKLRTPGALASMDAQRAIIGKLNAYFHQANANYLLPVADAEETSLLRGDIPYFYSLADSCDLFSSGHVVVKDYFAASGIENARLRLARMGEEELRFEKELLVSAFSMAVVPLPEGTNRSLPAIQKNGLLSQDHFYAEAETLMKRICDHALRTPDGAIGWMANLEGQTAFMRPDLMQGTAGLGVFLAACTGSGMTAAELYAEACLESLEGYIVGLEQGNPLQFSQSNPGLSGVAGILRALRLMATHIPQADSLYTRLLNMTPRIPVENAGTDVIGGVSGLISELSAATVPVDRDLIRRCTNRLLQTKKLLQPGAAPLWDTLGKKRAISGMGHGMAGIGSALVQAHHILGDADLLAAANDAFAWESRIYSEKLGTWPDLRTAGSVSAMHGYCSGAPGIGLALLSCMDVREHITGWDLNMTRALDACTDKPIHFRDHLCCGNAAVVDFLLEAGRRLDREDLTQKAYSMLSQMAQRAQEDYSYLPSSYQSSFTPSLFYGASGVGYTMLRAACSDLPSVLR